MQTFSTCKDLLNWFSASCLSSGSCSTWNADTRARGELKDKYHRRAVHLSFAGRWLTICKHIHRLGGSGLKFIHRQHQRKLHCILSYEYVATRDDAPAFALNALFIYLPGRPQGCPRYWAGRICEHNIQNLSKIDVWCVMEGACLEKTDCLLGIDV